MKQQNWNAKDYAKYSKGQELWARELIAKLDLQGNENILDLGCGDGKVTAFLAELTSGKVLGVDKSDAMVALAQKSYENIAFSSGYIQGFEKRGKDFVAVRWLWKCQRDILCNGCVYRQRVCPLF